MSGDTDLEAAVRDYAVRRALRPSSGIQYRCAVRSFSRWLGRPARLLDLAESLAAYLQSIAAGETRRSYRTSLVAVWNDATESGLLPPCRLRPSPRVDVIPVAFTLDEIRRLLAVSLPIQRAGILLAYDTGLRRGDLLAVHWGQVSGDVLTFVQGKSGRRLSRRLRPSTLDACRAVLSPTDRRLIPWPWSLDRWSRAFSANCRKAGINCREPGIQMVRRSAASYAAAAGQNAAELLGHSPASGDLARRYYFDPRITDVPPPLPPQIQ